MEQEHIIHLMAEFSQNDKDNNNYKQGELEVIPQKFYREVVFKFKFPIIEITEVKNSQVPLSIFSTKNEKTEISLPEVRLLRFKGEFYEDAIIISESIFKKYYIRKSRNNITGIYIFVKEDIPFYEMDCHVWISEQQMNRIFDLAGDEFYIPANDKIHKIISTGVKLQDYSEII